MVTGLLLRAGLGRATSPSLPFSGALSPMGWTAEALAVVPCSIGSFSILRRLCRMHLCGVAALLPCGAPVLKCTCKRVCLQYMRTAGWPGVACEIETLASSTRQSMRSTQPLTAALTPPPWLAMLCLLCAAAPQPPECPQRCTSCEDRAFVARLPHLQPSRCATQSYQQRWRRRLSSGNPCSPQSTPCGRTPQGITSR